MGVMEALNHICHRLVKASASISTMKDHWVTISCHKSILRGRLALKKKISGAGKSHVTRPCIYGEI